MSELLCTDILAVLSIGDYIFVGIGYTLRTYEKSSNKLLSQLDVCYPDKIHGIVKGSGNTLTVFGGKNLSIVEVNYSDKTLPTTLNNNIRRFNDWIIAVGGSTSKDDTSDLAVLFAHNHLCLYNWKNKHTEEFQCEEKCILYGGSVVKDASDHFVVFAGTVFQEIVVWAVQDVSNKNAVAVLHRLTGHNGVIFSVTFDPVLNLICTTSDDRTIRLWSVEIKSPGTNVVKWRNVGISLMTTMFGHTARVWRALIRKNFVISIGEDSLLCIWTIEGELINKIEAHHGAPIWSVTVSEDDKSIITGGGDGAVHIWPLCENKNVVTECLPTFTVHDIPKLIGFLSSGTLVVITQMGKLFTYNEKYKDTRESIDTKLYSSYVVMQISPNRKRIILGSLDGYVSLYEDDHELGCLRIVLKQKLMSSKILSTHWLNDDSILLCGMKGCLKMYEIINGTTVLKAKYILPPSRERWTTAANIYRNLLFCGDRAGSIHLFRSRYIENDIKDAKDTICSSTDPCQSLVKIHGRLGVHSCTIVGNKLLTTGRDGTLRFYELNEGNDRETIKAMHIHKMPMDWVSSTLKTRYDLYVLGFKEVDFVLYSSVHRRVLFRIHCGGGHRSWDCMLINGVFNFAYIRDKQIHLVQWELHSLASPAIENGFHTKEVCCIQRIPTSTGHNVVISGGEDRDLRITHITAALARNSVQQFKTIALVSGHISNVKTISIINLEDTAVYSENLIFSAGGRAQLKVWLISIKFDKCVLDHNDLRCIELASHMLRGTDQQQRKTLQQGIEQSHYIDPETRYMNIDVYRIQSNPNLVLLLVACSDGFLRIFSYNIITCNIGLRTAIPYNNRCIMKTHLLDYNENIIALTMATDGFVNFWNLNKVVDAIAKDAPEEIELSRMTATTPFAKLKLHQCGINSYDLKILKGSEFILVTGGDDNLICLVVFEIKSNNAVLSVHEISKWDCSLAHSTQVTGLILNDNDSFISVGIDQKVLTFNYFFKNQRLTVSLTSEIITSIADVQGMTTCCTNEPDSTLLCIYGKGFELMRRPLQPVSVN